MKKQVGIINKNVITLLNLEYSKEMPIFCGESNITHIKHRHLKDFEKYGSELENIISFPTYLARNKKKNSIEFIKEYKVDNDFVMVVVRVSEKGTHFVRTMYVMADEKVEKYFKYNYFIKVEKR